MEIGQILCPGCGAPITLMQGQKTGVCEYCQTSFNVDDLNYKSEAEKIKIQMERDKAEAYKKRLEWENEQYIKDQTQYRKEQKRRERHQKRPQSVYKLTALLFVLIPMILIFIAARTIFSNNDVVNTFRSEHSEVSKVPEIVYATKIEQIPKVTVDKINRDALKNAGNMYTALYSNWYVQDEYKLTGNYLVSYDDGSGNFLLTIAERTYIDTKVNKTETTYVAFRTNKIIIKDDGTTNISGTDYAKNINVSTYLPRYSSSSASPSSLVHGWFSLEELYLDCIMPIEKSYHINVSGDLYLPDDVQIIKSESTVLSSESEESKEKSEPEQTPTKESSKPTA